jgi:hypothetical protein
MEDKQKLCQKIRDLYPDIGSCGINLSAEWDSDRNAWALDLKKDAHELKTYLDPDDAEGCMQGNRCVALGIQIAQLKDNIRNA